MKTLLLLASLLPLATAHAQTPAAPASKSSRAKVIAPKTAEQRAENYQGPKVVDNTKALGHKMIQQSKPVDGLRMRANTLPVQPR